MKCRRLAMMAILTVFLLPGLAAVLPAAEALACTREGFLEEKA
jgi:hypothetical protein